MRLVNAHELSPAQQFARTLVQRHGVAAHAELDAALDGLSNVELAGLLHDWDHFWARAKQRAPEHSFGSWGFLTGRMFGKTRAIAEFINREVAARRARHIALIAQNETTTLELQVEGVSGLLATAPSWFRPVFERGRVLWPNGAEAHLFTPEVPGALRGPEHDLAWAAELSVWPQSTRREAFKNLRLGLRIGLARLVWDSNATRRHPILRYLLERASRDPQRHVVVRGHSRENAHHVNPATLAELIAELEGTQAGDEELGGVFFDESAGALVKQEWIEQARRELPTKLVRRVMALDPAISMRDGTDPTGFVDGGLTADGQAIVIADLSARIPWEQWGDMAVERYIANKCDMIVIERNRGGDACAANIARAAKERGLSVLILTDKTRAKHTPRHTPGLVVVLELVGRKGKDVRLEPVAGRYQAGRVSHVRGADLAELEDQLTTWEPDGKHESPNALDADVYLVCELLGLYDDKPDNRGAFRGIKEANERLQQTSPRAVANLLGRGRGRTI